MYNYIFAYLPKYNMLYKVYFNKYLSLVLKTY